jgi:hypothetical protein
VTKISTERWRPKDRWTSAEHLAYAQHGTWPESDEYLALKEKVLADAGLDDDTPPPAGRASNPDPAVDAITDDTSTDQILERLQKGNS